MRIVVTRELPGGFLSELEKHYGEVGIYRGKSNLGGVKLEKFLAGADVAICTINETIDDKVLAKTKLKYLITYSVGVNHVSLPFLKKNKIPLSYTPDVLTDATADLAWALILACVRHVKAGIHHTEKGGAAGFVPGFNVGRDLSKLTLGIIGPGRIGTAAIERARGFRMNVVYFGGKTNPGYGKRVGFEELLRQSDVISLHCPMRPENHHLIGRKELALMKKDAVFINTARGPLVDEKALVAHVRKNREFRAGLDVFEFEPKIPKGLPKLPNVVCLPHIGSGTRDAREAMTRMCVDEAIRFAKGLPLQYEYTQKG